MWFSWLRSFSPYYILLILQYLSLLPHRCRREGGVRMNWREVLGGYGSADDDDCELWIRKKGIPDFYPSFFIASNHPAQRRHHSTFFSVRLFKSLNVKDLKFPVSKLWQRENVCNKTRSRKISISNSDVVAQEFEMDGLSLRWNASAEKNLTKSGWNFMLRTWQ